MLEYLHMAGAVHRLQRKDTVIVGIVTGNRNLEHIVAIPAPVAGGFPQRLVQHLRRIHFLIAMAVEAAAHIAHQILEHLPAFGVPEHDARPLFLEMEQVHFAAKAAVVALLRFLKHMEIGLKVIIVCKGGAVDAGQHRIIGIAAPISARHLHQLE
ncbi:Uncharacterised protein [Brucella neotomae]|nr:Uncharacterised protein [Brucella neotomae]